MDMTEELEELRAPLEEVLLDSDRANGVDGISYSYVYKMNIVGLTIMKTMLIKDNQPCFDGDRRNGSYHYDEGGAV